MFTVILDEDETVAVSADYFTQAHGGGVEFYNKRAEGETNLHAVAYFPRVRYVLEGATITALRAASTMELLDELVWRADHGGAASGSVIGKLADVKESIGKLPGGLLEHRGEFE